MFMTALLTIAKTWNHPDCPRTDKGIEYVWHIHSLEYYSAIKKNETLASDRKGMNIDDVMLSEGSQTMKEHCMSPLSIC